MFQHLQWKKFDYIDIDNETTIVSKGLSHGQQKCIITASPLFNFFKFFGTYSECETLLCPLDERCLNCPQQLIKSNDIINCRSCENSFCKCCCKEKWIFPQISTCRMNICNICLSHIFASVFSNEKETWLNDKCNKNLTNEVNTSNSNNETRTILFGRHPFGFTVKMSRPYSSCCCCCCNNNNNNNNNNKDKDNSNNNSCCSSKKNSEGIYISSFRSSRDYEMSDAASTNQIQICDRILEINNKPINPKTLIYEITHNESPVEIRFELRSNPKPPYLSKRYFYYYEVTVLKLKGNISIGFIPDHINYSKCIFQSLPGQFKGTIGHNSDGHIYLGDDFPVKASIIEEGDTVGCGYCYDTNEFIFTYENEVKELTTIIMAGSLYYPCVGFTQNGCKIETNFGEKMFKYQNVVQKYNILNTLRPFDCECENDDEFSQSIQIAKVTTSLSLSTPLSASSSSSSSPHKHENKIKSKGKSKSKSKNENKEYSKPVKDIDNNEIDIDDNKESDNKVDKYYSKYYPLTDYICNEYITWSHQTIIKFKEMSFDEIDILKEVETIVINTKDAIKENKECDTIVLEKKLLELDLIIKNFSSLYVMKDRTELLSYLLYVRKALRFVIIHFQFYNFDPLKCVVNCPTVNCSETICDPKYTEIKLQDVCMLAQIPFTNYDLISTNIIHKILYIANHIEDIYTNISLSLIIKTISSLLYYEENNLRYLYCQADDLFNFIVQHMNELFNNKTEEEHETEEELIQYTLYIITRIIIVKPEIDSKKDITTIANVLYNKLEKLDMNSLEYFSFILCYTFPEYKFEGNIDDIYMKWFIYYLKTTHIYYLYLILSCISKYASDTKNCELLMKHPLFDELLEELKNTDENKNSIKNPSQSFDKTLSYYYGLCLCRIIPFIPSNKKSNIKIFKISCEFFQSREKLFSIMHQFGVVIVESILSKDFFLFFMKYKDRYLVLAEIINLMKCKVAEIQQKAVSIIHYLIKQEIESNEKHEDFINDIEYLYNVLHPFDKDNIEDSEKSLELLCDWMILMKIADRSFNTIPVNQEELLIDRFNSYEVENQMTCLKFLNAYFYTQKNDIKFPYSMTCHCPIETKLDFIQTIYSLLVMKQTKSEVNYDDLNIIYEFLSYLSYVSSYQAFLMTMEFVDLYCYYTNILSDGENNNTIINYIEKIFNKCMVIDKDYPFRPTDYHNYSYIYFTQHSFKIQHEIVEVILKSIRAFNGKIKDVGDNYSNDKNEKNLSSDLFEPCDEFSSEDILKLLIPDIKQLKITSRELLFPVGCMNCVAYKPMNKDNYNSNTDDDDDNSNNDYSFLKSVYPTIPAYIHELLRVLPSYIYREVFFIYSEDYKLKYEPYIFTMKNEIELKDLTEDGYMFIFKSLYNSVPNSAGLDKNKPKPFWCVYFKAINYPYSFNSEIFTYLNKCFTSSTVFNILIDNTFDNYNKVINDMVTSSFSSIHVTKNVGNFLKEFEKYLPSVGFQLPRLKALEFRCSELSLNTLTPFLNVGSYFQSLVSLNFSDIENLGCENASYIINSISSLQSLRHLILSNDGLCDDESSFKFIDAIKMTNIKFESLNLSKNRLSDNFMSEFFNAISNKRNLTSLNISSTELTFEISFNNFSQFLANCTNLLVINISNNKLKENIEHQLNLVLSLHPQLYHFFAMNNKSINEKNITYWQQLTKYSNDNQTSRTTNTSSSSASLLSLLTPTSPSTPIQETTLYQVAFLYSRPLVSLRGKRPEVFVCPEYDVLVSDICKNLSIRKEINVFVGNATLDNVNDLIQMNCEVLHIFARSINDNPNNNSSYFLFETSKNPGLTFRYDIDALKKLIRTCGKLSLLIITSERIDDIKEELLTDNISIESILLVEYSKSNSEAISNFFVELYQSMMNSLQLKEILAKTSIKHYLYPETNTSKYFTNKRSLKDSRYIPFSNPIRESYKHNILIYKCLYFCDKYRITTVEYKVSEANEKVANSVIDIAISFLELRKVFEVIEKYDNADLFKMPEENSENFKQKKLIILNGVIVGHNDEKIYKMCYKINDNTLNTNVIVVSKGLREYPINMVEGIVTITDTI